MSGLAAMLAAHGAIVTGEDAQGSEVTAALGRIGIEVSLGAGGLPAEAERLVFSAAIRDDHPTIRAAQERGIELVSYAEALGRLQSARTAVCVAGTHGKSTTTSLLGHVLMACGLDPSVIVGARCPAFLPDGNTGTARGLATGGGRVGSERVAFGPLAGGPGILVAEACEYRRSFLRHRPTLAVVTNIEEDHLDAFRDLDEIVEAFASFAALLPPASDGGLLLVAHEGASRERLAAATFAAVETYGREPEATWRVGREGRMTTLSGPRGERLAWQTPLPGEHSELNAAAAAILALRLGAACDSVGPAIESFPGLDRRMQALGRREVPGGSVLVIDDYGHHPTECATTLKALRHHHAPRRLVCVFQPHQHSRTRLLLDRFAESFGEADLVLVPDIHFVRDCEEERQRVSSADLAAALKKRGVAATHLPRLEEILGCLEATLTAGDLLVVMGAGPIDALALAYLAGGERCR